MAFPVSVKGVVYAPNAEVVLLRNHRGEWELPGGRIEVGESPAGCLAREIREELGLAVRVGGPIDSYLFEVIPERFVFIVTYHCQLLGGFRPTLSDEHRGYATFALDALPADLPGGYRNSITAA